MLDILPGGNRAGVPLVDAPGIHPLWSIYETSPAQWHRRAALDDGGTGRRRFPDSGRLHRPRPRPPQAGLSVVRAQPRHGFRDDRTALAGAACTTHAGLVRILVAPDVTAGGPTARLGRPDPVRAPSAALQGSAAAAASANRSENAFLIPARYRVPPGKRRTGVLTSGHGCLRVRQPKC